MDELRAVAVAAIMHDIGKFMQRAYPGSKRTFRHPELSGLFFHEKETGIEFDESKEFVEAVKFLVRNHHEEDLDASGENGSIRVLAEIISEADNISSRERDSTKGKNLALLRPIFTKIDEYPPEMSYYYKIAPLGFENNARTIIPERKEEEKAANIDVQYKSQWQSFLKEFKEVLKDNGNKLNPDILYFLEEKYLWCIPSAYFKSNTDISLFEHSKVTAAAATSLYLSLKNLHPEVFSEKNPKVIRKIIKDKQEKRFLLTGIDINGIQKFIYSISSKKALQSLKGRSFYVQAITNALIHEILWDKEINLYETNIIYSGGGKGYLLLPITAKQAVEKVSSRINRALFEQYGTEFSATIGYVEASSKDLSKDIPEGAEEPYISRLWKNLSTALTEKRSTKFTALIKENYEEFFKASESGGYFNENGSGDDRVICAICKKEIPKSESVEIEEGLTVCKECEKFIKLGQELNKEKMFLTLSETQINNNKSLDLTIKGVNIHIAASSKPPVVGTDKRALILNVADTDLSKCHGFLLNSGGKSPVKELSEFVDTSRFKRIGVLRMDVDNLGKIFQEGLGKDSRTLSRISQLSSSISLFFKGHLKTILNDEGFNSKIYVIYAGGDDLFAVGNWEYIPLFAKKVKEDFEEYVCHNPKITLSGGIYLMKDKYPIARGADYAGEAEDIAKSYKGKTADKNAIFFLGKALSWNDFEIARKIKDKLVLGYETKKDKSLVRKLQNIYNLYERGEKLLLKKVLSEEDIAKKAKWTKWTWMLAYYIGRSRKNGFLEDIKQALAKDEFQEIDSEKPIISYLDVPANWADLLTR